MYNFYTITKSTTLLASLSKAGDVGSVRVIDKGLGFNSIFFLFYFILFWFLFSLFLNLGKECDIIFICQKA